MKSTFPQGTSESELQHFIAAKRRRNNWLTILILVLPLFWFIPGAIYMRSITKAKNERCEANLQILGMALRQYASDNDDLLPPVGNWIEPVTAYCGNSCNYDAYSLHCPADTDNMGFSYSINSNLSGKNLKDIKDPHNVILLYETTSKESTPFGTGSDLVRVGKDNVGIGRHHTVGYRFNYYLMADGTVLRPNNVKELKDFRWK